MSVTKYGTVTHEIKKQRTNKDVFTNFDISKLDSLTKKELMDNFIINDYDYKNLKSKNKKYIINVIIQNYNNYIFWSKLK